MTAIIFPGQGTQYTGMSRDFFENFDISRKIFELISDITKIDIKKIIFENFDDTLNQTQFTQLAIFSSSISIFETLSNLIDNSKMNISCMLGHSLGEYTALTASKILSIEDCALLLKKRGELMQNAYEPNKSGMSAIIGLDCNSVENIIKNNNLNIEIANDNSPMQIVVSGLKNELLNSENFFKKAGAKKFVLLNVSAAFHSILMSNAENKLKDFIIDTNFKKSHIPIISNYDGKISNDNKKIKENLGKQMSKRVRWVESINTLVTIKEENIIEIGPGNVLSGLIKRINKNFDIVNIQKIVDMDKFINEF